MNKAEQRAAEKYPIDERMSPSQIDILNIARERFVETYEQAEKDLAIPDELKRILAFAFIDFLDNNHYFKNGCISTFKCYTIYNAFMNNDWDKLKEYI